ncbi:MAG TPA: OmpA family protein [Polyangiaceae bacterium]|nr:OmpA family protein [Polyangiaceae bacterium]
MTLGLGGCATTLPRPIESNAALGKVVVYRNGVAYFERYAALHSNELKLRVPAERLDDLLKSLTVVDSRTGKAIPVSFPTVEHMGDQVEIAVQLPKPAPTDLKISYVTESPAWKPSYRLNLSKNKPAHLEAWAVVDNVSGEDWERVAVGVGSSSALSFRFDLHSVRFVERETLSDGQMLGLAPPSGGSPYTVAGKELQVLANVSLDDLNGTPEQVAMADEEMPSPMATVAGRSTGGGMAAPAAAPQAKPGVAKKAPRRSLQDSLADVAQRAQHNKEKIRVEGFAVNGDKDRVGESLKRANQIRDRLMQNGLRADQIEVVANGAPAQGGPVRILAVQADAKPQQPSEPKAAPGKPPSDEPLGNAFFLSGTPLTVEKGQSALVSMLSRDVSAKPVYYFDPISARGSEKFAFRAALIDNPSDDTLDAGPFTVYADSQFLGEGLSDPIPAKSRAFIPFALDRTLVVDTVIGGREEIDRLITIQRGIVTAEARGIKSTKLTLVNRGTEPALTYVRHQPSQNYELTAPKTGFEKLRGAYLFPVTVPAGGSLTLTIEEATPIQKTVDARSEAGVAELGLYLKTAKNLPDDLKQKLGQVLTMHRELVELDEKLQTIATQIAMYRGRVDELNAQLLTLRKVPQAQELSRNLAKKMNEISDKLQKATLDSASVEGERLTRRVALEDRLAELTLESRRDQALASQVANR